MTPPEVPGSGFRWYATARRMAGLNRNALTRPSDLQSAARHQPGNILHQHCTREFSNREPVGRAVVTGYAGVADSYLEIARVNLTIRVQGAIRTSLNRNQVDKIGH